MSNPVIKVENLSKQYRIGAREGYKTFRETLVDAAKAHFHRLSGAVPRAQSAQNQTLCAMLQAPCPPKALLCAMRFALCALRSLLYAVVVKAINDR